MAKVDITNTVLSLNEFKELAFTAGNTDGFKFDFAPADHKMVLVFQNTSSTVAGTVTVKAGNGMQGVTDLDTYSIPANGFAAIQLESGYFKNVTGADKGKVIIVPSATTIKAVAINTQI